MNLEEAIKTAINYEKRIRDVYREAAKKISGVVARNFLKTMGDDEQHHLDYLKDRLETWQKTGKLEVEKLESAIPPEEPMASEMTKFGESITKKTLGDQKRVLSRALKVEVETSAFYETMVEEMSEEGRNMFAQFLGIENRHVRAVQMQLDYITKTGYWFDFKEFDME